MISFDQTLMNTMSKAYKPLHTNLNMNPTLRNLRKRSSLESNTKNWKPLLNTLPGLIRKYLNPIQRIESLTLLTRFFTLSNYWIQYKELKVFISEYLIATSFSSWIQYKELKGNTPRSREAHAKTVNPIQRIESGSIFLKASSFILQRIQYKELKVN